MKTIIQNILLLNCLLVSSLAFGKGGEVSGGADDFKTILAWFRDTANNPTIISTCYEVSPTFGVSPQTLESMISYSFKSWGDYLQDHRLLIGPGVYFIESKLDLHGQCKGNEDLKFYFGKTTSPEVSQGQTQFEHPYGFAEYTGGMDNGEQAFWGKGFVWITEDVLSGWPSNQQALQGLILHEVGHIFGNGHEDGTAMTGEIGHYLEEDTAPGTIGKHTKLYSTIDSQVELVTCPSCHTIYPAAPVFNDMSDPILNPLGDWKASFQTLTGKVAVPPLSMQYERLGTTDGNGKITVVDATGSYSFPVQVESFLETTADSTPLFVGQAGTKFYTTSNHVIATIATLPGKTLTVEVETNVKDHRNDHETGHKVKIVLLDGTTFPTELFVSDDPS
jgi:hypothetical protein